ncbi:MAG: glutamate 5-kinase [Lentimonas sp.]|jgi:glutamate 5-kinase
MSFLQKKKRIVIKIGSSLLVKSGKLKTVWLKSLTEDILNLRKNGTEVIIVSSGAVALGKTKIKTGKRLSLEQKRAASAIGQIHLMSQYKSCFAEHDLNIAQILITDDDSANRDRYLNIRGTINTLLKNGIIPIVNENDSVTTLETKIGDNDRLSARIAQIAVADLLILLSDIDGLYSKNPKIDPSAEFVFKVNKIDKKIEKMAGDAVSDVGTGGMVTKIKAAKMAFNLGCDCIIASGLKMNPIKHLVASKRFTLFKASGKKINAKKQWIADCLNANGTAIINDNAALALLKNSSLLPVGVIKIKGDFKKGDVIFVKNENSKHIANGIAKYDSSTARLAIGKNNQIELIHRDDLVLLSF